MLVNSYGLWMLENDEKHFLVIMHKKVLFSLSSFTSFTLHSGKRCDRISFGGAHVSLAQRQSKTSVRRVGTKDRRRYGRYYVVKEQAVPEVLLKVVQAKKLIDSGKAVSVNEAAEAVGISRSSFYKYKEDIFEFHDNAQGTTITLTFQMEDEPGILSDVLKVIAEFGANILTIHQSIPINGVASLSLSVQVLETTRDISEMLETMGKHRGVRNVKILAQE